jgi:hypothetical protein
MRRRSDGRTENNGISLENETMNKNPAASSVVSGATLLLPLLVAAVYDRRRLGDTSSFSPAVIDRRYRLRTTSRGELTQKK